MLDTIKIMVGTDSQYVEECDRLSSRHDGEQNVQQND